MRNKKNKRTSSPWADRPDEPRNSGPRLDHDKGGYFTNPSACPKCEVVLDRFTSVRPGTVPSPGDATICLYCGSILIFDKRLQTVLPDQIDMLLLDADPRVKALRDAYQQIKARGGPKPPPRPKPH